MIPNKAYTAILENYIDNFKIILGTIDTVKLLKLIVAKMEKEYVKPPKGILSVNKKATK